MRDQEGTGERAGRTIWNSWESTMSYDLAQARRSISRKKAVRRAREGHDCV